MVEKGTTAAAEVVESTRVETLLPEFLQCSKSESEGSDLISSSV